MHNLMKLKEVYKKVIEQATPLVELSLADGKQFDKEKFMFLIEATKGIKEIEELELMQEGKEMVYGYLDSEDDYKDGKRTRVHGYYRNGKRRRDSLGRYMADRSGKIVVKDTYDYLPDGRYGLNGLEYENVDEMNRTTTMRDDERYGRSYLPGGESRIYDDGRYKASRDDSRYEGMRNYRFKHKYKDEYDTEIEEEIYKVVESKPEEEQGETVEKIINVLAEPINDMKITYPRIYDKVINKIKVMKQ